MMLYIIVEVEVGLDFDYLAALLRKLVWGGCDASCSIGCQFVFTEL